MRTTFNASAPKQGVGRKTRLELCYLTSSIETCKLQRVFDTASREDILRMRVRMTPPTFVARGCFVPYLCCVLLPMRVWHGYDDMYDIDT